MEVGNDVTAVDQIPLEDCYTEAICLDLSHKPLKSDISIEDLQAAEKHLDPSLIAGLVPEMIRWQTPLPYMRRTANQDCEIRGKQIRTSVYALWDALGALRGTEDAGVSAEQIADYISKMKPSQLPVALQEAFWSAALKRQKFEAEQGDLWRTATVMKVISELLRVTRQSMTLMVDNVDQQTSLTPRQREIIRGIGDSVLADMRERVIEAFEGWDPSEDKDDADPSRGAAGVIPEVPEP